MMETTSGDRVEYKRGYKYQLHADWSTPTCIRPARAIETDYFSLREDGVLSVHKGYAWDGASGPMPDFRSVIPASLAHDCAYQAIRMGLLPESSRALADMMFYQIAVAGGLPMPAALAAFCALQQFGGYAAEARHQRDVLIAPAKWRPFYGSDILRR